MFLVSRDGSHYREDNGKVAWSISGLNVETGELGKPFMLPISSKHLLVVPGAKSWAFIEKGEVFQLGEQEISKVHFIPGECFSVGQKIPAK